MSKYQELQKIFIDTTDASYFIGLDSSIVFYTKLQESIDKPLKMILLFGKPGTGKTMLLNKLFHDFKTTKELFFIDTPIEEEEHFLKRLYTYLTKKDAPKALSFNQFIEVCNRIKEKKQITVLLDEAQLYTPSMMERIRLTSDTRAIKFVVSLHKTEEEDLIAKEHFQSRIWETIELTNGTLHDTQMYIQKKLIHFNYFEVANMFDLKSFKMIHHYTQGNYRQINKLIFTLFEIYDYYEEHRPSKIAHKNIKSQFIEMAAIKVGFIHA